MAATSLLMGCATGGRPVSEGDPWSVTLTGNPETVRECKWLASVAVGDYIGTLGGGPHGESDIPRWLRVQGVRYGGDTVLQSGSGTATIGEIYRCKAP